MTTQISERRVDGTVTWRWSRWLNIESFFKDQLLDNFRLIREGEIFNKQAIVIYETIQDFGTKDRLQENNRLAVMLSPELWNDVLAANPGFEDQADTSETIDDGLLRDDRFKRRLLPAIDKENGVWRVITQGEQPEEETVNTYTAIQAYFVSIDTANSLNIDIPSEP